MRVTTVFVATAILVGGLATPSQAAPPQRAVTLTAPYTDVYGEAACTYYGTPQLQDYCFPSFHFNADDGHIGGRISVYSPGFGLLPALRSNDGYMWGYVRADGSLRRSTPSVTVTVKILVEAAWADFYGTRAPGLRPPIAYTDVYARFTSAGCGGCQVESSRVVIADNHPSTPAPTDFSGEVVLQLTAQNVPSGPFSVYVENANGAGLIQGDTGESEAFLNADVTSIEVL